MAEENSSQSAEPPLSNPLSEPSRSGESLISPPSGRPHKWRDWHERETPVQIEGSATDSGVKVKINSKLLSSELRLDYPNSIWKDYPEENRVKLVDNITYIFTAHLPFLLKGNIRMEYNTGYPHSYSWATQCFIRFLPAYWYLYRGRRGTGVFPILKTMLNSRANFSDTKDVPPRFPVSIDENVVIPFTFGKDSFLTYNLAKEIGLKPTLVYFDEPSEEYSRKHKLELSKQFSADTGEKIYYLDNPLGKLREYGEGWFGWELALTSWALLSLPFAYAKKAGYIIFSNEATCNDFFYDDENLKVIPDYEQSGQATEELSILTQSLSEGEVYTTTFLQGVHDLAIISILKNRYHSSLKYLMSCWAETEAAKDKRWCADCSKCARIYLYLSANGIDPEEAGFKDNLFASDREKLFNIFGRPAVGTGFDAFGTNRDEQLLAFYLTYLRGNRDPLVEKFAVSSAKKEAEDRFEELFLKYFFIHEEHITPPQWKEKIDKIFRESLEQTKKEILSLRK
ncbi:MAG: hypothetical protein PHD51_00685 [Patescibacteria group bacterium]|nr:hypothetical protein [Patescibacteria group bacterium]MDD5490617.1 hypothetical protein [Patescibacteria group bacterium]